MTLPEMVQALLEPRTYPHKTQKVELMQTQMSWVFLTDDFVYKVKKPVDLGYLDYTTLDKRRFFCQQEVLLNRRLCPQAYLGVIPITRYQETIALDGQGEVIEYAVKMRRLPQETMMNVLLEQNRVSAEMVSRLAQKMVEFHQKAETNATISAFGKIEAISTNTEENFSQTERYIGKIFSPKHYQRIKTYTDGMLKEKAALFNERVQNGRIRDCHGDLHAAHICFTDAICIYDCIEFNDRFRYCDVASEIAFLAMDLDHYGRADLSRSFINSYVEMGEDRAIKELLNFYKCYRAYVRGKVGCFKYDDPYITEAERQQTLGATRSYFDLAAAYTRTKPLLLVTVGLVGTGKTTLARALAKRLGLVVISSDVTRKLLTSIPLTEHHYEKMDTGIYSSGFSRMTYDRMFTEARDVLSEKGSVILDASFIKSEERLKAKTLAEQTGSDFFILECLLDETTIKRRLDERQKRGSVSDGRWEIFEPQKKKFEPVNEVPAAKHVIINTSAPLEERISAVMDRIW